ncbi:MAG: class I SAM-dependent methyltransferase [Gammaproteobacteria bacterium]|nr:class I SAM-dependent methyltransferase [Gammaproteobacteria bacterium]
MTQKCLTNNTEQQARQALREWYQSDLGQSVLIQIQTHINEVVHKIYGYQGLQIGQINPHVDLLENSGLLRKQCIDFDHTQQGIEIQGDPCTLPIASDHINFLLMAHTLEFTRDPYQVLREADRVLTADGRLIIIGFSPYSFWGLTKTILRWRRETPWNGRFYSQWRINDWLRLLNFHVTQRQSFYLRPPLKSYIIRERIAFVEKARYTASLLGGVHMIVACKKTKPVTPRHQTWQRRRKVVKGSFTETARKAARSHHSRYEKD